MFKKAVALGMVAVMSMGCVTSAFAAPNTANECQIVVADGIEKAVLYIGGNKIISWEDGDYVITEQYDEGFFVCRAVGNRTTGEILSTNNKNEVERIATSEVGTSSVKEAVSSRGGGSYTSVGKIGASNTFTQEKNKMNVYESLTSKKTTTYTIKKYNGTLANYVSSVAIGLGVSALIAGNIVGALVAAGVGTVAGTVINITSSDTVSAVRYTTNYYGKDVSTSKSSAKITNSGYKYTVTDDLNALKGTVYYEGECYNPKDFNASLILLDRLVHNLYGIDFTPYKI